LTPKFVFDELNSLLQPGRFFQLLIHLLVLLQT